MDNPFHTKPPHPKLLIVLAVVIVILASGIYWAQKKKGQGPISPPSTSQKTTTPTYTTKLLSSTDITKLLPINLPLEKDAQVLQSSQVIDKEGTEQINYQFVTQKTLAENFNLYKNYLVNNGWKIQNTLNNQDLKSISATKETEKKTINITVSKNTLTGENIVDISLITSHSLTLLSFPKISNKTIISKSELPPSFQNLIKESSILNTEIQKLTYTNGQTGFLISGIIPNISLIDTKQRFIEFSRKSKWQLLNSIRTENFALIEYESGGFEIRVYCKPKQSNVEVDIQSITIK